jgi:type II secretory pathway pseudopilin PulG
LIEVVMTVIIVLISVTALVTSLASASASTKAQRDMVLADATIRNSVEDVKLAAAACTPGTPIPLSFSPPTGFTVAINPKPLICPSVDFTLLVTLTVTTPAGVPHSLQFRIRTP